MAGTRRLSRYEFVDTVEKIGRRRRLNVPGALSAHVGRSQPIASSGSRWHWHRPGKWPRWLRVHARINTVRPCAAPVAFVISFLLQGGPTTILMSAPGFPRFRCYAGDDRFCGTDSSNFSASRATSGAAYCLENRRRATQLLGTGWPRPVSVAAGSQRHGQGRASRSPYIGARPRFADQRSGRSAKRRISARSRITIVPLMRSLQPALCQFRSILLTLSRVPPAMSPSSCWER